MSATSPAGSGRPSCAPSSGRPLAAEYERARQAAEELRQSLRDSGATCLARLVRAVGCSVEFMPLRHEEVALLSELVRLPAPPTSAPQPSRDCAA
jgi:hypothetical protein